MENWPSDLLEPVKEIMWSQWAALGANLTVEPARKSVVDPEALFVATCGFGRYDARLFDEAMDWLLENNQRIKPWRLKRIARTFGADTQRVLGAALDYVADAAGKNLFPGVREEAKQYLGEVQREDLFYSEKGRHSEEKGVDPIFLKWNLLRGAPRIREHSGTPNTGNPANLMVKLREFYGTGTRADVMTYLLTAGGGSSNEIAVRLKYNQKGVYEALEEMCAAGTVHKYSKARNGYYWVERDDMAKTLGLPVELPVFFVWGDIYFAYYLLISDCIMNVESHQDDFLSAERMRNLTVKIVPLLRNSGEPLSQLAMPDIKRQSGIEHKDKLLDYMTRVLHELRDTYTL